MMASDVIATLRRVCSHVTDHGLIEGLPPGLQTELETALSPESLSKAFIDNDSTGSSAKHPGIKYDVVTEAFKPLEEHDGLLLQICKIMKERYQEIGPTLRHDPANVPLLRAVLVLLLCPIYRRPNEPWCREIIVDLAKTLTNIDECQSLLTDFRAWLIGDGRLLRRAVEVFHGVLNSHNFTFVDETIAPLLYALKVLSKINEDSGFLIPRRLFYLNYILEASRLDIEVDILTHARAQKSSFLAKHAPVWINFPFVLNVETKWTYLSVEALMIQREHVQEITDENFRRSTWHNDHAFLQSMGLASPMVTGWVNPPASGSPGPAMPQHPVLPQVSTHLLFNNVNRKNIIASAMDNVDRCMKEGPNVWLKPLQVNFGHGEFAVDAGGPSKEFSASV